jgi:hypothetical protein
VVKISIINITPFWYYNHGFLKDFAAVLRNAPAFSTKYKVHNSFENLRLAQLLNKFSTFWELQILGACFPATQLQVFKSSPRRMSRHLCFGLVCDMFLNFF